MTVQLFTARELHLEQSSVYRYLGVREPSEALRSQVEQICLQAQKEASFRVCYCSLPLSINGSVVTLGELPPLCSQKLADNLSGTDRAVLFCATCGAYFDRKINACKLLPSEAVIWDAVGTAAIEQLCDDFCEQMHTVRPRFSPGYGDLPLQTQRQLLEWLNASKLLGIGLTDSLLMTPTKSVTAIAAQESLWI